MKRLSALMMRVSRLFWWILSVPIFFKIVGIGVLVAVVFGSITLIQVRGSISRTLQQVLERRTRSLARSLLVSLEQPLSSGDLSDVSRKLHRTKQMFPDVRYVIVRDNQGKVVCHTFEKDVPADLVRLTYEPAGRDSSRPRNLTHSEEHVRVYTYPEGKIFDVVCPILDGEAGVLQLGITDQTISVELATVTQSLLLSLALCAAIGAVLAVWLTYILTAPIHHLVQTTNRIRGGDFESRAEIFSADEIGRLAIAINQMTEGLQSYRREVEEKEKARLSLLEKIVDTQEEERKSISRELHDHLGQSLLALLLAVQSLGKEHEIPEEICMDLEDRIRQMIDEAGRLAQGMRPPVLDDFGLDVALGRLMKEISDHSKLEVDYQFSCPEDLDRLPNRVEVTLYRISQEAMTNVIRHAGATRVSAVVLQRHDQVTLLVEDDGRGFDTLPVHDQHGGHLGLAGMKERAALLGGNCVIESTPEKGTTVQIRIPLAEV